jgi:hypothetical protein
LPMVIEGVLPPVPVLERIGREADQRLKFLAAIGLFFASYRERRSR